MEKFVAIYVRRSVSDKDKGNNSLSIASQKADCLKELKKGEKYRITVMTARAVRTLRTGRNFNR